MLENYQSPWMDEELVIMRDAVRKFLDKEFVPLAEKWDKQGFVDRDAWHKAGVEAGGKDCEDPPGIREGAGVKMYIAYLRDPAGNKICALHRM